MRFTSAFGTVAALALAVTRCFAVKCSTTASANDEAQLEALQDFTHSFLVNRNIQVGFDDWIPETYINHNPTVQSGREDALRLLTPFVSDPNLWVTVAQVFAGQGFGLLHSLLREATLCASKKALLQC